MDSTSKEETTAHLSHEKRHPRTHHKKIILCLTFVLGLFEFFRGFLLNRTELPYRSDFVTSLQYESAYERVILILVDGLAFDFIRSESDTYQNLEPLPFVRRLLKPNGGAQLFHFIADPPTTTLQRLKALTTGSMPTFVDVGSNFGGSAVVEDNLIAQWRSAHKRIVFVGDDTWMELFPQRFQESHPYPSFNVKDLDSVDNAVRDIVLPAMERRDWDILIGHMLGVDHCGHSHGSSHPEMRRKLLELDHFVHQIVNRMNPNDLLFVFGDHGMTQSGDHGGDSLAELDAALLVYFHPTISTGMSHLVDINSEMSSGSGSIKRIAQIDLVPTLASLTGVPIPFSNLGVCISELFNSSKLERQALLANFVQVVRFTLTYRQQFDRFPLDSETTDVLAIDSLSELSIKASTMNNSALRGALDRIQTAFRVHWTRFDDNRIWIGITTMFSVLFLSFSYSTAELSSNAHSSKPFFLLLIHPFLIISAWFVQFDCSSYLLHSMITSIIFMVFAIQCLSWCANTVIHMFLQLILGLTHLSNSYVVYEFTVTIYLIQAALIWFAFHKIALLKVDHHMRIALGFLLVGARLIAMVEVCREESASGSKCIPNTHPLMAKPLAKLTLTEAFGIGFMRVLGASLLLVTCVGFHFRSSNERLRYFTRERFEYQFGRFVFPICCGLLIGCWTLDILQASLIGYGWLFSSTYSIHWWRTWVARSLLTLLGFAVIHFLRLHRGVQNCLFKNKYKKTLDDNLVVSKSTSAYYYWYLTTWTIIPSFAFMIFLDEIRLPFLLAIPTAIIYHGRIYLHRDTSLATRLTKISSWSVAIFLYLLDQVAFFALGHQTTLVSLPWDAAFKAFHGDHSTQIFPALMILTHLFAGSVLLALNIPMYLTIALELDTSFSKLKKETGETYKQVLSKAIDNLDALLWKFLISKAFLMLSCAVSAALLKRHLMVWKIFAPRLFFSVASLFVSALTVLVMRISLSQFLPPFHLINTE